MSALTAVIVPAYNAERHLESVIRGLFAHFPPERVIVVDDGSTDRTGALARRLGTVTVTHRRNRGKGRALMSGIRKARDMGATWAITIDADGQHDPAEIPKFLEKLRSTGAEIIVGNRMSDTRFMPRIRCFSNRLTSFVLSARSGLKIPDSQNGYRLLNLELFERISLVTSRYETESEILIKAAKEGARVESVPVETIYGESTSSIDPFRDSIRFLWLVVRSFFW